MRIEEIILDGFKSYATRTVIPGWDPEFNAITGLNGHGKSNVLDAICFVLGITNLSTLRAANLQDLVYKRGQAGITKASVTIEFNNEDREKSPIGYENCKKISVTRQVVIGGRNKWLINGHNATQQNIQNLFQSVQLNVNNPHFLIMQGRITKVLNMKPPEILAMIEEAAGTRMYEEKKKKAEETIQKKDSKLDEISNVLKEEIEPKLEMYKKEKQRYIDFQKVTTELEHVKRLIVAYDYYRFEERLSQSDADLKDKQDRVQALDRLIAGLKKEVKELDQRMHTITVKREKDGGIYIDLDNALKEASKKLVKVKTQADLKAASIKEEEANRRSILEGQAEAAQALVLAQQKSAQILETFSQVKQQHEALLETLKKKEELLQTLTTGMAAEEGKDNGFMDQLSAAKAAITNNTSKISQNKLKIKSLEKQQKDLAPKAKKAEADSANLLGERSRLQKVIAAADEALKHLAQRDPKAEQEALQRRSVEQEAVQSLQSSVDQMSAELARFDFSYSDPEPGFDRSKVKGLVADLVELTPKHANAATALEICAGGRLFNVVVEDEVVGGKLLSHGKLKKRVTIIPLNKIQAFRASAEKISMAQKLAPGKVNLALNLVGYEEDVSKAMEYVFGGTLICNDAETAKKVTFDPNIRLKSVTLEGDEYNPQGTLSGGAKPSSSGIIVKMQQLRELKQRLQQRQHSLQKATQELQGLQQHGRQAQELQQRKDLSQHELALVEERIKKSANGQLLQQLSDISQQVQQLHAEIKDCEDKIPELQSDVKRIEAEMQDFSSHREQKLNILESEIKQLKKDVIKSTQTFKARQADAQVVQAELDSMQSDEGTVKNQISTSESLIEQYKKEQVELQKELQLVKQEVDQAQSNLDKERGRLAAFDTELAEIEEQKKDDIKQSKDAELELQKLRHEVESFLGEKKSARDAVNRMLKEHEWITDQRQFFGKPNTAFDFESQNVDEARKRLRQLEERYESLRKKTDMKVMDTIDRYEKKENHLRTMLKTVKKDKDKIIATIEQLDEHKRLALEKTYDQVNNDFGAIFNDLLPGNTAKLVPSQGKELSSGLEVKVCLGDVWKESLTELSGGQRSLIALSLILALLRYKPAPMYILDEVDAALDLSHTQNIGTMLRTRFKGSQFIVVSLKEGMFNNANVLFRAKFRDGVSTVERVAERDKSNKPVAAAPASTATSKGKRTVEARSPLRSRAQV